MRQCQNDRDLDAKTVDAPSEAKNMPPGPEQIEELSEATRLRKAADSYSYLFSRELTATK